MGTPATDFPGSRVYVFPSIGPISSFFVFFFKPRMGLSKLPSDSGALISETKISLQPKSLLFCGLAPPPGVCPGCSKKRRIKV